MSSSWATFQRTLYSDGFRGLYRGYTTTVLREIPFSLIQFPLWERLKVTWSRSQATPIQPWQSTVCGAFAGGVAALMTTPLDVAKTRIMLAEKGSPLASGQITLALESIWKQQGIKGLFAGVVPRVLWISLGGAIFLGGYEKTVQILGKP
jgi:solute carrier family 25 S-adenosylmethionine transporter 26